jgi:hypothetical protein
MNECRVLKSSETIEDSQSTDRIIIDRYTRMKHPGYDDDDDYEQCNVMMSHRVILRRLDDKQIGIFMTLLVGVISVAANTQDAHRNEIDFDTMLLPIDRR